MDRLEFEHLRDLPHKTIEGDIVLQKGRDTAPLFSSTVMVINSAGVDAKLRIEWNEETDSKTFNVWVPGTGPICRLEVDAKPHRPFGRSHKHSLQQPDCSHASNNLSRGIVDRSDLTGKNIQDVFTKFCEMAHIMHNGNFIIKQENQAQ